VNLRKSQPAEVVAETPVEVDDAPTRTSAKGRPTPKRRESTGPRGPVTAPKTRKEAIARQRTIAQEAKAARRSSNSMASMSAAERRAALKSGDLLPKRDKGKTRKLARDYVDANRMISNYMLFLFPIMIAGTAIPILSLLTLLFFFVFLAEWYIVGRRIKNLAIERFGKNDGGGTMAIGFYAGSRAYLPRKWRLPSPQVGRGDPI
jgi:hypothetical protein